MFLFFWTGVYADNDNVEYMAAVYPFYLLLILLIIERLAQIWIDNKFGCDEELMHKF